MSERKRSKPSRLGDVLPSVITDTGLRARMDQARVITEWPAIVGPQIARVTQPLSVTPQGVLFVAVKTNAWMNELSLMEPELLRTIQAKPGGNAIRKIRWQLSR
ncbi:MAG TPA: DUF721 domain-containing protein [Gemmatimonadaceae bacterium]|nr:DUF721 domain-containing protein [Gemmatimonadaceae bacterium]